MLVFATMQVASTYFQHVQSAFLRHLVAEQTAAHSLSRSMKSLSWKNFYPAQVGLANSRVAGAHTCLAREECDRRDVPASGRILHVAMLLTCSIITLVSASLTVSR